MQSAVRVVEARASCPRRVRAARQRLATRRHRLPEVRPRALRAARRPLCAVVGQVHELGQHAQLEVRPMHTRRWQVVAVVAVAHSNNGESDGKKKWNKLECTQTKAVLKHAYQSSATVFTAISTGTSVNVLLPPFRYTNTVTSNLSFFFFKEKLQKNVLLSLKKIAYDWEIRLTHINGIWNRY